MTMPIAQRLVNLAKAATPFFGKAEGGIDNTTWNSNPLNQAGQLTDNTGTAVTDDNTIATHLDVDPMSLDYLSDTYSATESKAHDQLSNYLNGVPADIISSAGSFTGSGTITPQYASAVVASREKTAFQLLTSQAMSLEAADHMEVNTGAQASVAAVFKAANRTDPTYKNGISQMAMDEAIYSEPANDPNFSANFAGQNTKTLLEFIATEMTLLNSMEYRRFLQDREMYKIQSASLNLQARTFNFSQNP